MKWGQDEAEHTNFRMQPGHSKVGHIPKHGALPSVLTADAPKLAPAVPSWCSLEVTPGPGSYELQTNDKETDNIKVQWSAFGATGHGKAVRQDSCFISSVHRACSYDDYWSLAVCQLVIELHSGCICLELFLLTCAVCAAHAHHKQISYCLASQQAP